MLKKKIFEILEKKFSTHPEFDSIEENDLNADYDGGYRDTLVSDEIIGFNFRSKLEGENTYQSFAGKFQMDFTKMRCIEVHYNKGLSPSFFKKVDKEFEDSLVEAYIEYYVLQLKNNLDWSNKKLVKFMDKHSELGLRIYEETNDDNFLPADAKEMFMF